MESRPPRGRVAVGIGVAELADEKSKFARQRESAAALARAGAHVV